MNKQAAKYKISPKGKRKLDYPTKTAKYRGKLPLIGKTIYLDVKDPKTVKRLQQDLKKLGATLEEFLSRDINYLITSQPRPKNRNDNPCGDENPSPSPFNCDPSPSPGYPDDKKVTSVTRGKALAEKARYSRQTNTLVDNAEKWGVKIVSLEGAFKWIDKELKKLPKSVANLSKKSSRSKCVSSYKIIKSPYVKLEGESFCYKPFHQELDVWPRLNVDTPRGSCPFDGTLIKGGDESREERGELLAAQVDIPSEDTPNEEKDGCDSTASTPKPDANKSAKKSDVDVHAGSRIMTAGELKRRRDLKRKQERKRGYCECCRLKYEDLDKHVKEEQHKLYVKNKTNYQELDALINSAQDTQAFLFDYLSKAAHLRRKHNSNSGSNVSSVRTSPRKTVQYQTIKSILRSPIKTSAQHSTEVVKSPKRLPERHSPAVRASPRKNLQKLMNNECRDDQDKAPGTNTAALPEQSPSCRIRRNSETKEKAAASLSSTLKYGNSRKSGSETQESGHKQFEKDERDSGEQGNNKNEMKSKNTEGHIEKVNKIFENVEKRYPDRSPCKTLSPLNDRCRVLNKSPLRRATRKVLCESVDEKCIENDKDCSKDADKENALPAKQRDNELINHKINKRTSQNDNAHNEKSDDQTKSSHGDNDEKTVSEKIASDSKNVSKAKDLSDESESFSDQEPLSEVLHNYQLTKACFTEILNCGKNRVSLEQSSDDFEVCFARSLGNETLPEFKNIKESSEKNFDELVERCEELKEVSNPSLASRESKIRNKSLSKNKKRKSKSEKTSVVQVSSDKINKNSDVKKDKKWIEKDIYDIMEPSDIPSDFQCFDEEAKPLTFSKTLAERIKERSMGRRSSVGSYNLNVLFQMPLKSRSNSFSSNQSDNGPQNTMKRKQKNCVKKISCKKSGSSIASAKVVNKYRNRRLGLKQNDNAQTGYQGDDENESNVIANDSNDQKVTQSNQIVTTNKQKQIPPKKSRKKFWHYEPVIESDDENTKESKILPKLLKELKVNNSWFSSDNSDTESRRSRSQMRMNNRDDMKLVKEDSNIQINNVSSNKVSNNSVSNSKALGCTFNTLKDKTASKSDKLKEVNERRVTKQSEITKDKSLKVKEQILENENRETKSKKKRFWYYAPDVPAAETDSGMDEDLNEQKSVNEKCADSKGEKPRKKRKKFWDYIPEQEVDSEKDEIDKDLPRELRELKASLVTFGSTERRRSRKSMNTVGEQSVNERAEDDKHDSESNSDLEELAEIGKRKKKGDNENQSETESISKTAENGTEKKKSYSASSRFWDVVVVDEKSDSDENENLPKELRILKFSKSDKFSLNASDTERRRRVKVDRNRKAVNLRRMTQVDYTEEHDSEITDIDSDSTKIVIGKRQKNNCEQIQTNKKLRYRPRVNCNESDSSETDVEHCKEEEDHFKLPETPSALDKVDEEHAENNDNVNENSSDKGAWVNGKSSKRGNRKKFWETVIVTENEDADIEEDYEQLPKELRALKQNRFWPLGVSSSRRSTSNSRRNELEVESEATGCKSSKKAGDFVESDKGNSNNKIDNKSDKVDNSNLDGGNFDGQSKSKNEDEIENTDSDTGRSRSKSRKRKVFWEFQEVPVDDDREVEVDKIPKELQFLRDSWNDGSIVVGRRQRSCQSYSERSDSESRNTTNESCKKKRSNVNVTKSKNPLNIVEDNNSQLKDIEIPIKNRVSEVNESTKVLHQDKVDELSKGVENTNNDLSDELDDDDARSRSPVFNVIPNVRHKIPRRKSPVFNRSPRHIVESESCSSKASGSKKGHKSEHRKFVVIGKTSTPKHSNTERKNDDSIAATVDLDRKLEVIRPEDLCSDSEDEDGRRNNVNANYRKSEILNTPEKPIPAREHGSGYSNTPREKRRKQWKRKRSENVSVNQVEKKRKLDNSNVCDDNTTLSPNRCSPRRRLLEPHDNETNKLDSKSRTELKYQNENETHAGHDSDENPFSLAWNLVESGEKHKKLNKSWSMVSDDDNANLSGFTVEDKLPSETPYEEKSEDVLVTNDKNKCVIDEQKSENEENLGQYVPVFFPSPNKTSNSSWNDAIDGYIDNSLKQGPDSSFRGDTSLNFRLPSSPRRSPLKYSFRSPSKSFSGVISPTKSPKSRTPKRNKHLQGMRSPEVKQVDNEIEFNFGSPQKHSSSFSKLHNVNGVVKKLSSSENLTSTPVLKKSKKNKHKKH